MSQSTRNALKHIEMLKKNHLFDPVRASRIAQSLSGEAQPFLSHVTPSFMPIGPKLGARGIRTDRQTDRQKDRQTNRPGLIMWI